MADQATILIVDDNPNNLQVLSALLSEAGYTVRPALSGEQALRAVEARLPDLILLDVRMPPGIDGYETCRRLRANPNSRDVPVIFISALDETSDKLSGFDAGGVDFIAKPFEVQEVLARVRTHIQLHRMQHQLESMVRQRTEALTLSEARYRILFEDSPIPILVFDCVTLAIPPPHRRSARDRRRAAAHRLCRATCTDIDAAGRHRKSSGRRTTPGTGQSP